jgi:hypothetical protein
LRGEQPLPIRTCGLTLGKALTRGGDPSQQRIEIGFGHAIGLHQQSC